MIKLNDVLKPLLLDTTPKGVFKALSSSPYSYEWANANYDYDYLLNNSGLKLISPLVKELLDEDGKLPVSRLDLLVSIIDSKYSHKWAKLYATYELEYNPIENYNSTEHKETNTDVTVEVTNNNSSDKGYAFNSTSPVPIAETSEVSTTKNSGNKEANFEDITRSGNIGVTTSQQMIQSEIDLWKWNFIKEVYKDLDDLLTLPIY